MKMQIKIFTMVLALAFILPGTSGCAAPSAALSAASSPLATASAATTEVLASTAPAYDWELAVVKAEIKDKLHTDAGVTLYDGTTAATAYDDAPQAGDVYLLIELTANKEKPGGGAFLWDKLTVRDTNGSNYNRMANDTFISSHNYKRLPGTDLKLGDNMGWVCFEIPAECAGGKLLLVYAPSDVEYTFQIH